MNNKKLMIGMVHLPPLPGYPKHPGMPAVISKALVDLETLEDAGFDGILVENDNDQPHQIGVNNIILEAFRKIMKKIKSKSKVLVGMEIIYDMQNTVQMAVDLKLDFVRLDVFADTVSTRWGVIAESCMKVDEMLQKTKTRPSIYTDVHVKHAQVISGRKLRKSVKRSIDYGSSGIILTGNWTGEAPNTLDLIEAKKLAGGKIPVLVGSGLDLENAAKILSVADGAIVGTSIKTGEYIDKYKATNLIRIVRSMR